MTSLGEVMDRNKGIGPGFDFLRVFLALSIVLFHSLSVTNQYDPLDETPFWIVHYSLVPMFFALSGFLISASARRLSLKNFLINRSLRIVPALAVDTVICAFLIGPLFTSRPLAEYFTDGKLWTYLFNIIGYVHFTLPGVFDTLPTGRVNGALWTVPFEIACYGLMSILIITRVIRGRYVIALMLLAYLLLAIVIKQTHLASNMGMPRLSRILDVAFIQHEAQAVTGFLVGINLYQNRDRIPYSRVIFSLSCIVMAACAITLDFPKGQSPVLRLLLMPAIGYVMVFVGLTPIKLPRFFSTGDYSYGIYLYHMPILQAVMSLMLGLTMSRPFGFAITFAVGLPLVLAMAWLSWHLVEKPILAVRKRYSITARLHAVDVKGPEPTAVSLGNLATPELGH